ncbi:unnamed protein product [Brassica oleracea]
MDSLIKVFFCLSVFLLLGELNGVEGSDKNQRMYGFRPTKLVVFGDSYADTGNIKKSLSSSWKFPYGITFPGKPAGRFSDGRVSTDFLAKFVGIKSPIPYFWKDYAGKKRLQYGMNFAYGGTGVFKTQVPLPNMTTQIDFFQNILTAGDIYSSSDFSSSVALVSVAGNDYSTFIAQNRPNSEFPAFIKQVVDQTEVNLRRIHALGVKKIAVPLLQPLGCLPGITVASSFQRCNESQNALVKLHNSLLQQAVAKLNNETKQSTFIIIDLYNAFLTVFKNKGANPGSTTFQSPLKPCCVGVSSEYFCGSVDEKGEKKYVICDNPKAAFFWDGSHPTEEGWRSNMSLWLLILSFYLVNTGFKAETQDEFDKREPYIVYMGDAAEKYNAEASENHHNLLSKVIGDENKAREVRMYSYGKNIDGFVARLLPNEVEMLSREEGVVSVFKNTQRQLHTTRSWDFLGFVESKYRISEAVESNIIVGVLDTGIYIDSPSFDDKGFGPPPAKWKGKCVTGNNLTRCNNKVIGARYYHLKRPNYNDTAADYDGHGTHITSTIAGVAVSNANLFGIANGTARGGVPSARIATYKVCWEEGCSDMDMLAAFDEAISDGVDMISISIGGASLPFFEDPIAIGSFHAMKRGILTTCSAGNNGPGLYTVSNLAPWVMTVAANSVDRKFETVVKLGNGDTATGISVNGFNPKKKMYPLTSGFLASNVTAGDYGEPSACEPGTMGEDKAMGKIVYCEVGREEAGGSSEGQDHIIRSLKGAGVIVQLLEPTDMATSTLIPGSYVLYEVGTKISDYINSTKNPQAVIFKTRTTKMLAPSIASFSARGPQRISPNILKPDISAPGLNILAAYSKLATVTVYAKDTLFSIMSGTSMACPHAAAAAAYVKSFHPDWSPAAIKSALMTTATPMRTKDIEAELSYGSGQINPRRAIHPGLVYDITETSYLSFLCKEGYNSTSIGLLLGGSNETKKEYRCVDHKQGLGSDGLNYPSMHKQVGSKGTNVSETFYRTVRSVGYGPSTYVARVWAPKGVRVEVEPRVMSFVKPGEEKHFKVVIDGVMEEAMRGILSASVEWDDSRGHLVRSPILLFQAGKM